MDHDSQPSGDHGRVPRRRASTRLLVLLVVGGAFASAVVLALSWLAREPSPSRPRVVVFLSLDTLRPDHLGTYGHVRATSPVLDALADRGVVFEDAWSTAPWTLPAHATMFTGLYPSQAQVRSSPDRLPATIPTIAEQLRDAGYRTVGIASAAWFHLGGLSRGFDEWQLLEGDDTHAVTQTPEGLSDRITQLGLEALRDNPERPVFLFLHYFDVHSDYVSLPEFEALFLPENFRAESRVDGSTNQLGQILTGQTVLDDREKEDLARLYDAGIRQLDSRLAPLFDWIEAEVGWKQALVVVTSDHGEAFLEHDSSVSHGLAQYEEQLRVPLIMAGSDLPSRLRVAEPVSIIDIVPTLLGATGVAPASPLPGHDLARHWQQGANFTPPRAIYAQSAPAIDQDWLRAVKRGRYKLIVNSNLGTRELFDLYADPRETRNLVESLPGVARELAALLDDFERQYPDSDRTSEFELDDATRKRLRALGYTEQD